MLTTTCHRKLATACVAVVGAAVSCFSSAGCAASPQPRVIAERVFPGNELQAVITTFPGDPPDGLVLASQNDEQYSPAIETQPAEVEGRRGWRLRCVAPADARSWTLQTTVHYAGRRFRVEIPFRYRKVYVARKGRGVSRWTTGRERIRDLGPIPSRRPDVAEAASKE